MILLLPLLFIFGCSHSNRDSPPSRYEDFSIATVDVPTRENTPPPVTKLITQEEDIFSYGPKPIDNQNRIAIPSEMVIAVYLGPGLNRVLSHLSFLKTLKASGVSIKVLSGVGMGAVIAAQYASGLTISQIEWHFHRFFEVLNKTDKVFSLSWKQKVNEYLLGPLKKRKIEHLKRYLFIPLYDSDKKQINFFKKGFLIDVLRSNLNISYSGSGQYSSALFHNFSVREMRQYLGIDLFIGVNVLGKKISFENPDGYLIGLFGRAMTNNNKVMDNFELNVDLPVSNWKLDGVNNFSNFLLNSKVVSEMVLLQIKQKIIQWDEQRNQSTKND